MKKSIIRTFFAATLTLAVMSHAQAQDNSFQTPATQSLGYMVISYDIKDQASFQEYMDAAGSLGAKFNGKVIIFNMKVIGVEGKPRSVFGMVEFPSLADAQRFYNSPEYTAARKFRIAATKGTSTVILTEGLPQQ